MFFIGFMINDNEKNKINSLMKFKVLTKDHNIIILQF